MKSWRAGLRMCTRPLTVVSTADQASAYHTPTQSLLSPPSTPAQSLERSLRQAVVHKANIASDITPPPVRRTVRILSDTKDFPSHLDSTSKAAAAAATSAISEVADQEPYWMKIGRWKDVTHGQYLNYSWHIKNTIQGRKKLFEFLEEVLPTIIPLDGTVGCEHLKTKDDFIQDVAEGMKIAPMAVRLPPHILSVINWNRPLQDPIRKQFLPLNAMIKPDHPLLKLDSLHEEADSPVPGLVHRYHDKVLFLSTPVCPLYCRHCTRSYGVGADTDSVEKRTFKPMMKRWEAMFDYVRTTSRVRDVVISGGDCYYLTPDHIRLIGHTFLKMPHIQRIRFATRGLCASPSRLLDDEDDWAPALIEVAKAGREKGKHVAMHTQFNHPDEIQWTTAAAALKLFKAGVVVRNQSVILRGINDDAETMSKLIQKLSSININPYYVYQGDMVQGVEDLRTPLKTILDIEQKLRGTTAGFLTPQYVVDLPGGGGKRLAASYVSYNRQTGVSKYMAPAVKEGQVFEYHDPTWSLPTEA